MKRLYRSLPKPLRTVVAKSYGITSSVVGTRKLIRPVNPVAEMSHLTFSLQDAIDQTIVNREINERIRKGYFVDRLIIVAALPKTASSVIGSCIAIIQSGRGIDTRRYGQVLICPDGD